MPVQLLQGCSRRGHGGHREMWPGWASVALTQLGAAEPCSSVCIKALGGDEPIQISASPLLLGGTWPSPALSSKRGLHPLPPRCLLLEM